MISDDTRGALHPIISSRILIPSRSRSAHGMDAWPLLIGTLNHSLRWHRAGRSEAAPGLVVHVSGQWPVEHRSNVLVEVRRVQRPHDGGMHVRVGDGAAQHELRGGYPLQQLVHLGVLPELPDIGGALPWARCTAGD